MKPPKQQTGLVKRHADGFGFLIADDPNAPDIYIPRNEMRGILTNDRVSVNVFPDRGTNRFRGEIAKIFERNTKKVVGTYQQTQTGGFLPDEAHAWGEDLFIDRADSKNARPGELVEAEVISYGNESRGFRGQVVQVLGHPQDPFLDIKKVLVQQNVPHDFPRSVEQESKNYVTSVTPEDHPHRRDLRKHQLVTIDGATAKDFDDAICVEANAQGFRLLVAIADVSFYVRDRMAIDQEAYLRGTSVYFPHFVVPMLPEVLSNELCSLKPKVPRLALVADMQFNFQGERTGHQFYEAIIESQARLTYGQAQDIVDGTELPEFTEVSSMVRKAADLAKILLARRFERGSLDLDIPETELLIDPTGVPVDVVKSERLFAHRLIEEMMLAANVSVAEFLASRNKPTLYRIHESPKTDALVVLEKYAENFGHRVKLSSSHLQKKLNRILESSAGKAEAQVLHMLTLRSMAQAKYSPENVGHFGLGFDDYVHFTSPIRRYPDLIVHRVLKTLIPRSQGAQKYDEDQLATAGTLLSACEQRAVKAERQVEAIKKARFLAKYEGQEFDGTISSVVKFGVFVLLKDFEIDGLVRLENLAKEPLEYDEEHLKLVARRSGRSFSLGDPIRIVVESCDIDAGQVNFRVAGMAAQTRTDRTARTHARPNREHRSQRPASSQAGSKQKQRGKHKDSERKENRKPGFGKKAGKSRGKGKKSSSQNRRGWSIPTSHR